MPEPFVRREALQLTMVDAWAHSCAQDRIGKPTVIHYRNHIVQAVRPAIQSLLQIKTDQKSTYTAHHHMWIENGIPAETIRLGLLPYVHTLESKTIGELTQSQRELLAFYSLTNMYNTEDNPPHKVKPHKLMNRLLNAEAYGCTDDQNQTGEDWLMSASFVTEIHGISLQDIAKAHAKQSMDAYLENTVNTKLGMSHFTNLSHIFAEEVYPYSTRNPLFQDHPIYFDFQELYAQAQAMGVDSVLNRLAPFTEDFGELRQRNAVADFFDLDFPIFIGVGRSDLAMQCADIYVLFMAIHPAPDGNSTIISSLIDFALKSRIPPLKPISSWNKVKAAKPTDQLRDYVSGNPSGLYQWFEQELCESNPDLQKFFTHRT